MQATEITPDQEDQLKQYFKKGYIVGGQDFSWWYNINESKWHINLTHQDISSIWMRWMRNNEYVDWNFNTGYKGEDILIFTDKFIKEVING